MKFQPARLGNLIAPSGTHTSQDFAFPGCRKLSPLQDLDAEANQLARVLVLGSQEKLQSLRRFEQNWDGYDSIKPRAEAIANAEARLPELYRQATARGVWREPHISASEAGEVSFEWWSGSQKVTMYFGDESIELIRVWGADMETEMDLQQMPTLDSFPAVWAWLYGN